MHKQAVAAFVVPLKGSGEFNPDLTYDKIC